MADEPLTDPFLFTRAVLIDDPAPSALLMDAARELARALTARQEAHARRAVRASLRPRLRWAARRPRALRMLKRVRLWTPPNLVVRPVEVTTTETGDGTLRVTAREGR